MAMTLHAETQIQPPRGKAKKLYAQAETLREAAERLMETTEEGVRLSPRIDDRDLWRPESQS